jgi:DNA-binding NarL/FixJ family response regulator
MPKLRVFLADDHRVLLAGLRLLVTEQSDMEVVGEASDGLAALRMVTELRPDVAVLDQSMPGLNGSAVTRQLRLDRPDCKVVVLTVHEDHAYVRELLDVGAVGYVLKRSAADELIRAIRVVAAGGVYLDPAIAGLAAGVNLGQSPKHEAVTEAGAELSERELEVLRLTALGNSNKMIATALRISVKTVETYKARAMEKRGFRTRVDIVRFAVSKGWMDEG